MTEDVEIKVRVGKPDGSVRVPWGACTRKVGCVCIGM